MVLNTERLTGRDGKSFRHCRPANIVVNSYAQSVKALKRVSVHLSRAFPPQRSTTQWCSQIMETSLAYLNGIPTVQPVAGPARVAVGQPAFPEEMEGRGGFVTLRPHGGRASIVFERDSATTYSNSYCSPKVMEGIKINFASPSAFYTRIPQAKVCTGVSTVNVSGVVSGLKSWL